MTEYILQSTSALALTFLIYKLILEKTGALTFNRIFLLSTLLLGIIGPMCVLNTGFTEFNVGEIYNAEAFGKLGVIEEEQLAGETVQSYEALPGRQILVAVTSIAYILISLIMIFRFGKNLYRLLGNLKERTVLGNGMKLVVSPMDSAPYSFLNYLIISKTQFDKGGLSQAIIEHEYLHYRQQHSLDVLFIEGIKCIFWFNPLIWVYAKILAENHEFQADEYVLNQGLAKNDYAIELINNTDKNYLRLSNSFSYLSLKKRIKKMNTTKTKPIQRVIRSLIALVLIISLFFTGAFTSHQSNNPMVVVIDPGHGGKDMGASNDNVDEKDIALEVSKKVATLLENKSIKVIMTRETDEFLTLAERVEVANNNKPDLFLSVHVNGKLEKANGLNAFFHEGEFAKSSEAFSKIFVENSIEGFSEKGSVLKADFYVLKNTQMPSILVEVGGSSILNDQASIASSLAQSLIEIQKKQ